MSLTSLATSLKEAFNRAQPGSLPSMLHKILFGNVLRALVTHLVGVKPAADSYQLATLWSLGLPESAKASTILRAYARTTGAAGTLGELAVQAFGTTPADGQIAVAPNGDLVVLAASAYTAIDVLYQPMKYDVVELTLPVVTNDLTIPATFTKRGVLALLEAESLVGGTTGKFIPVVPSDGAPGTTKWGNLNVAKTKVKFKASDAVTSARVKLAVAPGVDLNALLEAADNDI